MDQRLTAYNRQVEWIREARDISMILRLLRRVLQNSVGLIWYFAFEGWWAAHWAIDSIPRPGGPGRFAAEHWVGSTSPYKRSSSPVK